VPAEVAFAGHSRNTWGFPLADIIATGPSHAMSISQEPRRQLEWLMQVNPAYVLSYPTNLEFLARLAEQTGLRPPALRGIQAISETLTPDAHARISSVFGVPVWNLYSSVEAGYMATPCPSGAGYHVHAESILLEVLDPDGRPCGPGEQGRVVFTTLQNHRTPLVRYAIGDEAVVGPAACPCGRGLPTLHAILGKSRPFLPLPDGRSRCSSELADAILGVGGMLQYQCEQQAADRLLVRVVPGSAWSADHAARVVAAVHVFFDAPIDVHIELVERVPLTPGGKCPNIIPWSGSGGGNPPASDGPEVRPAGASPAATVRERTLADAPAAS
jgi:phenylacetate-CoA ligase